jgi:hypothetical protein
MLSQHYQGNTWWIMGGLFSLFIIVLVLWSAWQRRKVGMRVDVAAVVGVSACLFVFVVLAIVQVLTH